MPELNRNDKRHAQELRPITFDIGIAPNASGSVLIGFGNTRVICAATIDNNRPRWMQQQNKEGGWITAEYSMLPYSTLDRKTRDISRGRADGRSVEIQRLIGRSLRAITDLSKLPNSCLWIDCDVLQADGGTRCASITGAYLAARLAVEKFLKTGQLKENPFIDSVAAVSVGLYKNHEITDLNYLEDKDAMVDFNIVMTGKGKFVEVQGSGEEASFSQEQLDKLISLARKGISDITKKQNLLITGELDAE
jgi:ribonuclease PH